MKTVTTMAYLKSTPGTHRYEDREDPYCKSIYAIKVRGREKPKAFVRVTIEDYDLEEEMTNDSKTP